MKFYNVSLEGSSHKVSGLPCQDFSKCEIFEINQKMVLVMSISDGHGSKTYVRSHIGSRLACEIALDEAKAFISQNYNILVEKGRDCITYGPDYPTHQDPLFSRFFASIHSRWCETIKKESEENPFSEEEQEKLGTTNIKQAYGCTLIVAIKTKDFVFAFQIGDGRLFTISPLGDWSQPVPWDSDCVNNFTTSLCEDEPIDCFRYYLNSTYNQPLAIFMCSDGIEDCYGGSHDGNFKSEKLVVDYSEVLRCFLEDSDFDEACRSFLISQSKNLSHDDMSIAFVFDDMFNIQKQWIRLSQLRKKAYEIKAQYELYLSEIKECENRIEIIKSNISNCQTTLEGIKREKDKTSESLISLKKQQEEDLSRIDAATSFKSKICDFNTAIEEYCDEFRSHPEEPSHTSVFRNDLIQCVIQALGNAINGIHQIIGAKQENYSKYEYEIESLQKKIDDLDSTLKIEEKNLDEEEYKLLNLTNKRDDLIQTAKLFKDSQEPDFKEFMKEKEGIIAEIQNVLPSSLNNPADGNNCNISDKTLNVCKMCSGHQEAYITISPTQVGIIAEWNSSESFVVLKESYDELICKIQGIEALYYAEVPPTEDYIAILLPYENDGDGVMMYLPCDKKEAIEIWNMCLDLRKIN